LLDIVPVTEAPKHLARNVNDGWRATYKRLEYSPRAWLVASREPGIERERTNTKTIGGLIQRKPIEVPPLL